MKNVRIEELPVAQFPVFFSIFVILQDRRRHQHERDQQSFARRLQHHLHTEAS